MSTPLGVTPAELRTTAKDLADISSRMKTVLSSLNGKLDADGPAWGSDDNGQKFANGDSGKPGYIEQKSDVGKAFDAKTSLLDTYSDGLRTAADTLESQDEQAPFSGGSDQQVSGGQSAGQPQQMLRSRKSGAPPSQSQTTSAEQTAGQLQQMLRAREAEVPVGRAQGQTARERATVVEQHPQAAVQAASVAGSEMRPSHREEARVEVKPVAGSDVRAVHREGTRVQAEPVAGTALREEVQVGVKAVAGSEARAAQGRSAPGGGSTS